MASFTLLCFAFLALISQQIFANADVIASTCDKALFKDVCQSIFSAHPESKSADLNGLANIALDSAIKQGKDIQFKIVDLSKSSGPDKAIQQRLTDCSNNYQHAIVEFDKSKKALESKSYADINTWITAAMTAGETCEDGFKELPGGASGGESPLTEMNNKFKGICSTVLTITNQLDGKA